jgi:hypothetical protein
MRATREELMIVLRSVERQGLIASYSGSDGQVRWRLTKRGNIPSRAIQMTTFIRFPSAGMRGRSVTLRETERTTPTTIIVGYLPPSREAALAYDRAVILPYREDVETYCVRRPCGVSTEGEP